MTEQGVRYQIKKESFRTDTDIEYFTTTKKALLGLHNDNHKIWTSFDEEELLALEDINI
jgi:gamma-glutamylcysteine synthetase